MQKNPYPGKPSTRAKLGAGLVPHLVNKMEKQPKKNWFFSVNGKPIFPRKKGAGFIVFEGLDGSGQSTQAALLKDFLTGKKYEVLLTKEPTNNSEAGKKIREILDKKSIIGPKKLQELFARDRKLHLENEIYSILKEGKIVISDRYCFSSFAFGAGSGVDLEWLIQINKEFLLPDLTFILKVSPEICIKRITKRNKKRTLFEEKEKLEKVWQIYETMPPRFENIYIVDGEKSIEGVFSQVKAFLQQKLNL